MPLPGTGVVFFIEPGTGVVLREKKEGGTFAKYKKIKKRLSQSFGKLSELIFHTFTVMRII